MFDYYADPIAHTPMTIFKHSEGWYTYKLFWKEI